MTRKDLAQTDPELFNRFLELSKRAQHLSSAVFLRPADAVILSIEATTSQCGLGNKLAYCEEGALALEDLLDGYAQHLKRYWEPRYRTLGETIGDEFVIDTAGLDYAVLSRANGLALQPGAMSQNCYWSAESFRETVACLSKLCCDAAIHELLHKDDSPSTG